MHGALGCEAVATHRSRAKPMVNGLAAPLPLQGSSRQSSARLADPATVANIAQVPGGATPEERELATVTQPHDTDPPSADAGVVVYNAPPPDDAPLL